MRSTPHIDSEDNTQELIRQCELAERAFRNGDNSPVEGGRRACLELFRLALAQNQECAWQALPRIYRSQLLSWTHRHPHFLSLSMPAEEIIASATSRFWQALQGDMFRVREPWRLAELLLYWHRAIDSTIHDQLRRAHWGRIVSLSDDQPPVSDQVDFGWEIATRIDREQIFSSLLEAAQSEAERAVLWYLYHDGYKPAALVQLKPELFSCIEEVYAAHRNLLRRLRRHREKWEHLFR